ncbi:MULTISPECIES: Wzz/FepE/Etk N-terminal domain-containing protein [Rhodanobacter]|uniref:Wzz/FepE/Etk N-terminal domain-containing protein n=1 Tax=Rhodanobacter TaxID=75309 RepID=UPI0003F82313|nr:MULTISPECIES: Wzz/FepE/Etk N-terminal domain-containing protein [Rhodanobacter]TAN19589.1 MAG: lipopolysaccharide biosynthesis protein [Rhodanobacter sp.]UJJ54919.1 Wzz/FepE/Etk N-terminal domain-containing protein [Rhodanobacter thiooxydans]
MERDEIYLIDLWRIFTRQWQWFVLVLVLTLACTYAFAHLVKRQWEATAWIQIAQVGSVPAGQDPKVEPLQRVTERLQLVPFQNQVLASAGYAKTTPVARLYRNSLKLEPMLYAGSLVKLTVRAYSPQQAGELAAATVARLRAVHRELEEPPLQAARARLVRIEADLGTAEADHARYQQAAEPGGLHAVGGKDMANPVLASLLLANKNEEVRGLTQQRNDLVERLGPAYTYDTSMVWPAYVPEKQAFPNPELTYGLGLLLALFLGASAALARDVARRSRA